MSEEKTSQEKKKHKLLFFREPVFYAMIAVFFVIGIFLGGSFTGFSLYSSLSPQEAGNKVINYINTYMLQNGVTASLESVTDAGWVYQINLTISGPLGSQTFTSYVTKDGKFLFVSGIDITKPPKLKTSKTQEKTEIPKTKTPNIKMFVMSFCPYGKQAERGLGPVVDALKGAAEVEPHFVIYSNYAPNGNPKDYCLDNESKYCSMHGINELKEDVRQLCIWKYFKEKWWDYVKKVNENCNLMNINKCWKSQAEAAGIDPKKIIQCSDNEALDLLEKELSLNKKYGIRGSPTVLINDVVYRGGRSPEDYKKAICSAFETPPKECNQTLSTQSSGAAGGCKS